MTAPSPRNLEPMTPSLSADNMPTTAQGASEKSVSSTPPLKRKIDDDGSGNATRSSASEGKENDRAGEKRARIDMTNMPSSPLPFPPSTSHHSTSNTAGPSSNGSTRQLVTLAQGALRLEQAAHVFAIPRRKMLGLEAFLYDVQDGKVQIDEGLPEEYHSVIVMAGQESSLIGPGHLINHIKKVLDLKDLSGVIPSNVWSNLVETLFRQKHYGVIPADIAKLCPDVTKIPASLQIRRWEAKKPSVHFDEQQLPIVRARMAERAAAREEVVRMLGGMSAEQLDGLLKGSQNAKGRASDAGKEGKLSESPAPATDRKSREGTAASVQSGRSASPVKKSKMTPEEEEAARVKTEEREAKQAVKEEKRKQKEEKEAAKLAEVQKKDALLAKQKQTMNSFFKPKAVVKPVSVSKPSVAGPSKPAKIQVSDFDRVFKPIAFRPNVEWAPVNRFRYKRRSVTPEETRQESEDWQVSEHVKHLVKKSGVKSCSRARLPKGLKSAPPFGSVGDVWLEHQDALDPRKVLNQLKNQRKFPWKTLAFDGQVRPPYSGTFTKKSIVVGPRTPFAQDPMFDYSYDSGDDWQDDEGGEDVDDNANLEPEEQEEDDGEDEGEFDDWLDDSDDVVVADSGDRTTPMEIDGDAPVFVSGGESSRAPAQVKVVKKKEVPPKRVVKVTPTWRGPLWEREIGEGNEGMEMYRIQLLNDTPDSIDPFTYTSSDPTPLYKPTFSTISVGIFNSVKTLLAVDTVHESAPALDRKPPPRPSDLSAIAPPPRTSLDAPPATVSAAGPPKTKPSGPKIAFPTSHLPELLRLVEGNKALRIGDLITQLKTHFEHVSTKIAIEFKLKEVAVKEGRASNTVWRVLPEAWSSVGLAPPSRDAMVIDM